MDPLDMGALLMGEISATCRHCGRGIVYLGAGAMRNGWAHIEVEIEPGDVSPLEEPCEINPRTLRNARGTKFAEPVDPARVDERDSHQRRTERSEPS